MQEDAAPVGKGWSQPGRPEDERDITDASLAARGDLDIPNTDGECSPECDGCQWQGCLMPSTQNIA